MTFPALDTLAEDSSIKQVAWRVYRHLERNWLDFREPRGVKVEGGLAGTLHIRPASITAALNQLVLRGYLIEHEKGVRGVRRFTLAWSVQKKSA